ncbi:integral membrane protein [Saccharopolyspora erythraea NRRL 2338]|uniref:Integral membrane protein n=2 Tax=Saccharopolyspora erythraea TaxID=1836 RepID=A4FC90_SACEN|nr:membrane protein [Saccharopolyspora erythraea D]CAM01665.1 integral membrane protein [Saccharopolyspora erythraea NRRL 2338]
MAGTTALRWRLTQVLVMLAVVLGGLSAWFLVRAEQVRASAGADAALVDVQRTAAVRDRVVSALEAAFSYRHDDPSAIGKAAADAFTGPAAAEYERLFAPVREQAAAQQVVLRTTVSVAGVRSLEGPHALLLVFLDQTATRGDTGGTSAGAAQLSVTADEQEGNWRITGMRPH